MLVRRVRRMDWRMDAWTDGGRDGWMGRWTDGGRDAWMDGWTDGRTDGWRGMDDDSTW